MSHTLWIGGGPASGKTTVATRIARRHGLRLYSADTRTWEHRDRALAAGNAAARRWEAMTLEERWERSTSAEMLEMSLHRERGAMVLDDLRALPPKPLAIAEGLDLARCRGRPRARGLADPDPRVPARPARRPRHDRRHSAAVRECGDPACDLDLELPVGQVAAGPALGHS